MPSVTYDGRSFMVDGKRIWLVSGSIHYARVAHEHWQERIHAAKLAGLNTIETPVFWNRHEARPGHFDFKGDNDLRRFVQLIGQAGMYCILRPGPFVGQQWDAGGLPPWLTSLKSIRLRAANGPLLEACSRYLTAVAGQIRDLQVTSPGKPGPVVLVQSESAWTCGDDAAAQAYLGELNRYLRESGINVPIINANNLWAGAEGEVDCWTGGGDMLPIVRQLAAVKPHQPRLVVEFNVGSATAWGDESPKPIRPEVIEQRLAQILAAGGQFNIQPFHGGTNFGFWGGRLPEADAAYPITSRDMGAPLSEVGTTGASYQAVRRICTFASRFSRLFAHLEPEFRPVVPCPVTEDSESEGPRHSRTQSRNSEARSYPTVVHCSGTQGGVAFIFRGQTAPVGKFRLLLPHGGDMVVDAGDSPVSWCLFDTYLGGRAKLDYCGLSAWGTVGRVLVVFGAAGCEGVISINGSVLRLTVPRGKAPLIVEHEGVSIVVCTPEQLESVQIVDDAVFVGASGLTLDGHPLAAAGERKCTRIGLDGVASQVATVQPAAPARGDRLTISEWQCASMKDHVSGASARFAAIPGPADLSSLGAPFGYGWYRIKLKSPGGKVHMSVPHGGDRLHVSLDGEAAGLLGSGPGAENELAVTLKKGATTMVVLAENLGRVAGGASLGESKGIFGDIWEVHAIRAGKPSIKTGDPVDVLSFRTPLWEIQSGDATIPERLTWTIQRKKKSPVIVTVGASAGRGLLLINNKPFAYLERGGGERHFIPADQLKGGANTIQIALLPDHGAADSTSAEELEQLAASVSFSECIASLSGKAEWAFARWEPPRAAAFGKPKGGRESGPIWWRAKFGKVSGTEPVFFDAAGLTKGQLYVNGRHVCRYFVATGNGKPVAGQQAYYIPSPWLSAEAENEVLVFDEHGGNPGRCRLVHGM